MKNISPRTDIGYEPVHSFCAISKIGYTYMRKSNPIVNRLILEPAEYRILVFGD